jgi:hypothetical protein
LALEKFGANGEVAIPDEHDRPGLGSLVAGSTHVQSGIIEDHGSSPHHHRVEPRAQPLSVLSGGLPGDPLRGTIRGCQLAIQGQGRLQGHARSSGSTMVEVGGIEGFSLDLENAFHYFDALPP